MKKMTLSQDPVVNSLAKEVMQYKLHTVYIKKEDGAGKGWSHITKQHLQNRAFLKEPYGAFPLIRNLVQTQ